MHRTKQTPHQLHRCRTRLSRCREHLAAFGEAGVTLPLVMPYPIAEEYGSAVRRALDAFAPR
jgi:hypothetical protein